MLRATKLFVVVGALATLLSACKERTPSAKTAAAMPPLLTILYTCDTRGHIDPCGCSSGIAGGIARRRTFVSQQTEPFSLLVDAGDVTAGKRAWELLEFEYLLKGYREMGYSAVNAGLREASLNATNLAAMKMRYPFLISANLLGADGKPVLAPFVIVTLPEGHKAAIIGIVDDAAPRAEIGHGLTIAPAADAISKYLPEIRKQTELIVLLAFADENKMRELAERFYEIRAVIGGRVLQPSGAPLQANRSVIAFITDKGKGVGKLQVTFDGAGAISSATNSITLLKEDVADDAGIAKLIAAYKEELKRSDFEPTADRDDEEGLTAISSPRSKESNKFVGADACKTCHVAAHDKWAHSGHSHAFKTLIDRGYETNPRCLTCHTVGYMASDGFVNARLTPQLKDVSCESCHGRGEHHVRFYSAQNRETLAKPVFKKVNCVTCHNPDNSTHYEPVSYWEKIKHGKD